MSDSNSSIWALLCILNASCDLKCQCMLNMTIAKQNNEEILQMETLQQTFQSNAVKKHWLEQGFIRAFSAPESWLVIQVFCDIYIFQGILTMNMQTSVITWIIFIIVTIWPLCIIYQKLWESEKVPADWKLTYIIQFTWRGCRDTQDTTNVLVSAPGENYTECFWKAFKEQCN